MLIGTSEAPNEKYRKGIYPTKSFPAIIGTEAAGTIVGLPTDQAVLNDPEYQKRTFDIGGKVATSQLGAFAEYMVVPWNEAFSIPTGVTTLKAAGGLLQSLTATSFMEEGYNVQKGDIILIHTVAGGLGLIMCQLAKYRGATVIGTTSTKAKAVIATEHGCDHVILYTEEDTVERVLEITKGDGVNAIFDGVGKDTYVFQRNFVELN
jgi:NADPH2:quinone reductase